MNRLLLSLRRVALSLALGLWLPSALALNGKIELSDLHHDIWTGKDGAPGEVTSMAQTADGWLWIGSTYGIYLFDGVRFRQFEALPGETAPKRPVTSLTALPNGDLLIGYFHSGMSLVRKGHITHFPTTVGPRTVGAVSSAVMDADGVLWAAASGELLRLRDGAWHAVGPAMGLPPGRTSNLTVDQYDQLWIAAGKTLLVLDRGTGRFRPVLQDAPAVNLIASPDGRLWLDTHEQLLPVPPQHQGPLKPRPAWLAQSEGQENGLFDRDGNFWALGCPVGVCRAAGIGAMPSQPMRPNAGPRSRLEQPWQLSSLIGNVLFEDRDGHIWVGTQAGLERFRHNRLAPVRFATVERFYKPATDEDGQPLVVTLPSRTLWRLHADRPPQALEQFPKGDFAMVANSADGALLVARPDRIERRSRGKVEHFAYPDDPHGTPGQYPVTRIADDGLGLWVSGARRGTFRLHEGKWSSLDQLGLPPSVFFMAPGARGSMWLGYNDGLVVHYQQGRITRHAPPPEANVGAVTFLHAGAEVVVGGNGGLAVLRDGRFRRLRAADPDALASVSGMAVDARGDRWFNGSKGVVHVRAADWRAALASLDGTLKTVLLGAAEGYPGAAALVTRTATAMADANGQLWFVGSAGMARLDSNDAEALPHRPRVQFEALVADGRRYLDLAAPLELAAGTNAFRVDYTALSYRAPELVQFRYQLVGVDAGWQDASTRRSLSYTNLAPGDYRLRMAALDALGQWSDTDAALAVRVLPTFTQTRYFDALCAALVALALYLLYLFRLKQATRQIAIRIAERERIARALHDSFLQSVQGLVLSFQSALAGLAPESPTRGKIERVLLLADRVIEEGRDELQDLRSSPMGDGDLGQALGRVGELLQQSHHSGFSLRSESRAAPLHGTVGGEAYYIGREALVNAFRHAQAAVITVTLNYGKDRFSMQVSDDGKGIAPEVLAGGKRQGHWGLPGMSERARRIGAQVSIDSDAGGTRVTLTIPAARAYAGQTRWMRWMARLQHR